MNRLSVIIPVYNGESGLEKTLESLVTQTTEDFEVIIVDDGSTDSTSEICCKYCNEYVDFFYFLQEHAGVYAARNRGMEKAESGYFLFLDCGDSLTERSIEAIIEVIDKDGCDIVTGRCWKNGDIEYEYDSKLDIVASMPEVEKLESSLLWNEDLGAKVFHRKFYDLHKIKFFDLTAHGELLFILQSIMKSSKICGCPEFILDKDINFLTNGYSQFEMPTYDNLKSAAYVISEIYEMGKNEIIKATGECDGDEFYCQEIVYMAYQFYLDKFYRRYWYMTEDALLLMREEFEKYAKNVQPERFRKLQKNNQDIRLPYVYTNKNEAAKEPAFTILFDIVDENDYSPFLRSLYAQTYPFFEIIINESRYNSTAFPAEFKSMENIRVLPDKNFHTNARSQAYSKNCLELRGGKPLDIRTFRETCLSKAPSFLVQYVFGQKRQSYSARKTLKDKGLNLQ